MNGQMKCKDNLKRKTERMVNVFCMTLQIKMFPQIGTASLLTTCDGNEGNQTSSTKSTIAFTKQKI